MSNWYDDLPEIDQPVEPYLANLAAHNDRLFARVHLLAALHDENGPLVVVDLAQLNAWADHSSRDFDVDPEAAA